MPVRRLAVGLWFGVAAIVAPAGCGYGPGSTSVTDGNVNPDPTLSAGKRVSGEPNDSFGQALDLILNSSGIGRIQGTIGTDDDIDVYDLGPVEPGDRIRVDLNGYGSLDAAIAIFDDMGRLFAENDDRNPALNQLDPFLNEVVRHEGTNYYLAVGSAPLGPSTGSYSASVVISRGEPVPPPKAQPVVLDFNGGSIYIPGDQTYTVGVFNTGDIDPAYAGMTTSVKRQIVATVEHDFAGLALELYTTDGSLPPAGTASSTVLFGGSSPGILGISQAVDPYNGDATDEAIIFTNSFRPSLFGRVLTAQELGEAIGNVAAHEMGHLLGLNHVADPTDLMDTTGSPSTLLDDQVFKNSVLDWTVWPFGTQNGLLLLMEILGLTGTS